MLPIISSNTNTITSYQNSSISNMNNGFTNAAFAAFADDVFSLAAIAGDIRFVWGSHKWGSKKFRVSK